MTNEQKKWIDEASYSQLLKRWRFGDGDNIFQGETGAYYAKVMTERREALEPGQHTAISKIIGWG